MNNYNGHLQKNLCIVFEFQHQVNSWNKLWQGKQNKAKTKIAKVQVSTLCLKNKTNTFNQSTRFFYKQHFYKQRQAEIGRKLSKS